MRNALINGLIFAGALVLSLLAAELLLRSFTRFPIHAPAANQVFDERLLYRIDPNLDGFDSLGFRNPEALVETFPRIAAIGDSHTLGYNVRGEASWPGVLRELTGEPVYNFGVGSYGLLQYVESTRLALEKGARTIVLGFFPLNDMMICNVARLKYWTDKYFSDSKLRSSLQKNCGLSDEMLGQTSKEIINVPYRDFGHWLRSNSALSSLLRHSKEMFLSRRDVFSRSVFKGSNNVNVATDLCAQPTEDFIFQAEQSKDFLFRLYGKGFPGYFESAISNEFSKTILMKSLKEMRELVSQHEARLYVVLIPSEARVKYRYLIGTRWPHPIPPWVKTVADGEEAFISLLSDTMRSMDLPVIDATDRVVEAYGRAFEAGRIFYPCHNRHPLKEGYRAYARAAFELVRDHRSTASGPRRRPD